VIPNDANTWLSSLRPSERASVRIICFPYAGGGAGVFRPWTTHLPAGVDLFVANLPGRDERLQEHTIDRMSRLVVLFVDALASQIDGPFCFYGHSMGALVSYEVTRELRRRGLPLPLHLFIGAFPAPQTKPRKEPVHELPDDQFIAEMVRSKATPTAVLDQRDLLQIVLPRIRADLAVIETYAYTPEPRLPVPITTFGGAADTMVNRAELEAWRQQTTDFFSVRMLLGDHYFIDTNRARLLYYLSSDLQEYTVERRNLIGSTHR
jgi:surfactin synthase thioesterase subunit